MKTGIYLGPPVGHARGLAWLLVGLASVGTALHISSYVRERAELGELRSSVEREDVRGRAVSGAPGDDAREVLSRLRAVSESGVAATMSPAELLYLVSRALPDQMALVGVSFEASSSPPSLLVEAVALRDADVTVLQKRVAESPHVAATQLLGERTSPDGSLSVRLRVDLAMERAP